MGPAFCSVNLTATDIHTIRIVANETIPDLNFYFYYIPGITLGPGKTAVRKTGKTSALLRLTTEW